MDSVRISLVKPTTLKFKLTISGTQKAPEIALQFPFRENVDFSVRGKVEGEYVYVTIPALKGLIEQEVLPAKLVAIIDDVYTEPWRGELIVERQPKAVATLESVRSLFVTDDWERCATFDRAAFVVRFELPRILCFVDEKKAKPGRRSVIGWKKLIRRFPTLKKIPKRFRDPVKVALIGAKPPEKGKRLLSSTHLTRKLVVVYDLGDEWIETAITRAVAQIAYWSEKESLCLDDEGRVRYAEHLRGEDPLIYALEDVAVRSCISLKEGPVGKVFSEWWTH